MSGRDVAWDWFPWVLGQNTPPPPLPDSAGLQAGKLGHARLEIAAPMRALLAAFHGLPRRWQASFMNAQPAAGSEQQ